MTISNLLLRIVIAFITLLVLTRIMGRKELSEMTFINFVSGITIGAMTANLVINSNVSIRNGVLALVGWSAITIFMGYIDIKSKKARNLLEGQPRIFIKNGQIMEDQLRKERLDIDALKALLRQKNIFSISDVEYAIFEIDGKLSVMKKESKQPVIKSDLNIRQVNTNIFPIATSVISDGKVDQENLEKLNLDKQWLDQQLQQADIRSVSDVFYAEVQKDGKLYIDNKNDNLN
ncbi:YetF domain-containing protein [Alkalihalobacillus deserti]|uniref:YetF domain-containing protein n=1 Tax=Alkalihalobacillus deserti TaxID=2879466 RepID=UPI001D14328A|nr:DUF421 domain-containing protein [Alkalihalobacillus deserti]